MSPKPGDRRLARRSIADRDPVTAIEVAVENVVRLTLELTSANGQLAYADAVRARNELKRALLRAQSIAESLPGASKRALALHRVHEIREVAARQLAMAPTSSSAEAGDKARRNREAWAWVVSRLASRPSTGRPRRRTRGDTLPDAPKALREASGEAAGAAAAVPATVLAPNPAPAPGKAGTR